MSFKMQREGAEFLAGMLAGSGLKINGMYVEYGKAGEGVRDHAYFDGLRNAPGKGFARVAISHAYVDGDLRVHFNALVRKEDMTGDPPDGAMLTCASLVCMKDGSPSNDVIVCTVGFTQPVALLDGAYTTVHASMKIGA